MFFCVFFSLYSFFLLLAHYGCALADSQNVLTGKGSVVLFLPGATNVSTQQQTESGQCTVKHFYLPFLVATDDVVVAIAGANCSNSSDGNVDIVAKYIENVGGDDWGITTNVSKNSESGWKSQFVLRTDVETKSFFLRGIAAVATDKKVYFLFSNHSLFMKELPVSTSSSNQTLQIKLAVGTVSGDKGNRTLTWKTEDVTERFNTDVLGRLLKKKNMRMLIVGRSSFLTEDKKIVLALKVGEECRRSVYALIYLNNTENNTRFEASYAYAAKDCRYSFFFPWKEKIIMLTYCYLGENHIKESSDLGNKWIDSTGPLVRLFSILKNKRSFITVTIENTNILLFAQQRYESTNSGGLNTVVTYLWATDGNRVHVFGPVFSDDSRTYFYSFLYTNGKLFSLQQQENDEGVNRITIMDLTKQLDEVKLVLRSWGKTDRLIAMKFNETIFFSPHCATAVPTDGLVGFLSNTSEGNYVWQDEYLYVNATVRNGTKVTNGFSFNGVGSGVIWPVGKNKYDQAYNFTDPGFTLAANVIIGNSDDNTDNSLIGVGIGENKENVGLWCTKEKKWGISIDKELAVKEATGICVHDRTYNVLFVLERECLVIYINCNKLTGFGNIQLNIKKKLNITHFYFGVNNRELSNAVFASNVTVKNVLLYNRPFTSDEINDLKN